MNRHIIFAHFDPEGVRDDSTLYFSKALTELGTLRVVSTGISPRLRETLSSLNVQVIERENIGYDFFSYKIGIEVLKKRHAKIDQLILTNDSIFAPILTLSTTLNIISEKPEVDAWGATSSKEIRWHLQSFFLVFNQKVLESDAFNSFWDNVLTLSDKTKIIKHYEIGLTQSLILGSFNLSEIYSVSTHVARRALFDHFRKQLSPRSLFRAILNPVVNPTIFTPLELLKQGAFFVKRELVEKNPARVDLNSVMTEISRTNPALLDIINSRSKIFDSLP